MRRLASYDEAVGVAGGSGEVGVGVSGGLEDEERESKNNVHSCWSGYDGWRGVAGSGCCSFVDVVVTLSDGLRAVAGREGDLRSVSVGLVSNETLSSGDDLGFSSAVMSLEGEVGAESSLPLSSLTARPLRDMRSRISSRLGNPFASIRLVGEQAPESTGLGDTQISSALTASPLLVDSAVDDRLCKPLCVYS